MVRLDHLAADDHGWITSAYHLTREIRAHLESLERSLLAPSGTGLFVIGPYGSGKSHFLAYVVEALRTGTLAAGGPEVVALSLVNYRGDTPLEDIICRALGVEVGGGDRRLAWSALSARHPRGLLLVLDELSEFLRSKPDPPLQRGCALPPGDVPNRAWIQLENRGTDDAFDSKIQTLKAREERRNIGFLISRSLDMARKQRSVHFLLHRGTTNLMRKVRTWLIQIILPSQ